MLTLPPPMPEDAPKKIHCFGRFAVRVWWVGQGVLIAQEDLGTIGEVDEHVCDIDEHRRTIDEHRRHIDEHRCIINEHRCNIDDAENHALVDV